MSMALEFLPMQTEVTAADEDMNASFLDNTKSVILSLQEQLDAVKEQRESYQIWLQKFVASNLQALDPDTEVASGPENESIPSLLSYINTASSAHSYVSSLKTCTEATRELEVLMRQLEELSPHSQPEEYSGRCAALAWVH
jgi:hypothetical protein